MQKEIEKLRYEASARSRGAAPAQAPQSGATGTDETVRVMLASAQRVCDETVADAKRRAQEVTRQAQLEAEGVLSAARDEDRRLNIENESLRDQVSEYRRKFRQLLDDQLLLMKEEF